MAQPRRSHAAASTAPSMDNQLGYMVARKRVFQHLNLLRNVTDPASARDWVALFGKSMSKLSARGEAVGIDPAEDIEVRAQLGVARIATIKFATAEWINLSPELVNGLEESLRELAPGETLASALPPPPSASSWLGLPAPSMSHNSSAGSGVPRPTLPASAGGRGDQVARSLPRVRLLETPQPSPISAAPPPAVAAAVRRTSFVSDPGERPVDWVTCERCRLRHTRCAPFSVIKPYISCYSCLKDGAECVSAPKASGSSRSRSRQRAAGSSGALPVTPPFSTAAPRSVQLAWHAQARAWLERDTARDALSAAVAARDGAEHRVQIASSRVKALGERHRVACRNYLIAATSKGKGKGAHSPH